MAEPQGKPSSLWETFHQDTHTGMAYVFYYTEQTPMMMEWPTFVSQSRLFSNIFFNKVSDFIGHFKIYEYILLKLQL